MHVVNEAMRIIETKPGSTLASLWIVVAKAQVLGMTNSTTLLLVEDNPDDAALTEMALRETPTRLEVAADAQEALDYLALLVSRPRCFSYVGW